MPDFGIVIWKTTDLHQYTYDMIKEAAIEAEKLDFNNFWIADHFHANNSGDQCYECYTTLSSLASVTNRIRLGPLVTCVSYRQPSLLAKMTAMLDIISNGRLIRT